MKQGGRRQGAGRKPGPNWKKSGDYQPRQQVNVKLPADMVGWLRENGITETIERLVEEEMIKADQNRLRNEIKQLHLEDAIAEQVVLGSGRRAIGAIMLRWNDKEEIYTGGAVGDGTVEGNRGAAEYANWLRETFSD